VRNRERLVGWDTPPDNVTFVLDAESRSACHCQISVAEDGIYVDKKGTMVIVR